MVRRWRIFAYFLRPVFSASRVQHISDLHSTQEGHIVCVSMVDIQSATAEHSRGKKKKEKKKERKKELECGPMLNVMAALPNIGGVLCSTPQSLADAHY